MKQEMRTREPGRSWRPVFAIVERDGRTFWPRVGTAFENSDGSVTLKLDALPVSGQLQIRDSRDHEGESPRPRRILRVHGTSDVVGG